jgi:hypothetical protein
MDSMASSSRKGLRALLVVIPAALAAVALMPASASAQSGLPQAYVCVGNTEDGGFSPQQVNIPTGLGIGFGGSVCVATPDVDAILTHLKNLQAPGAPEIPDEIPNVPLPDPQNPLSVLGTVLGLCSPYPDLCNTVLGSVLGAPIPLFADVTLNPTGGSCEDSTQLSGFASGGSFSSLEGHADWTQTAIGDLGTVAGSAQQFFPNNSEKDLSGAILTTDCAGGPALGLFVIV